MVEYLFLCLVALGPALIAWAGLKRLIGARRRFAQWGAEQRAQRFMAEFGQWEPRQ